MSKFDQISRYLKKVYPSEKILEQKLKDSKKLKIYLGIDPTSTNIHLGNAISLLILRQFQDWGHKIVLVFGDFTGSIGDPSGHDKRRKPQEVKQLADNTATYKEQVGKILDFKNNPPEIVYNSEWWAKTNLKDFLEIVNKFTLAQLVERDLFQERIKNKKPIAISEFLYPILQGYDSVEIDIDVEIGGSDQTFNMLIGREMMRSYKNKEKIVLTTPLLEGTDGRKMSKSYGNTIDLNTDPNDMFGKVMSLNDNLIIKYMLLTTAIDRREIERIESELESSKINPMEAKKRLSFEIVKEYRGVKDARLAEGEFERVVQRGEPPKAKIKIIEESKKLTALEVLLFLEMVHSKSEAKRLIEQGGVSINGKRVESEDKKFDLVTGTVAQIGKLKAIEIKIGR